MILFSSSFGLMICSNIKQIGYEFGFDDGYLTYVYSYSSIVNGIYIYIYIKWFRCNNFRFSNDCLGETIKLPLAKLFTTNQNAINSCINFCQL